MGRGRHPELKRTWFLRIKDLIDQHHPDFLYSDGSLPFQQWGLDMVTHYYNSNALQHHGKVEGVYTSKHPEDCAVGTCALDVERGVVQDIWPNPWQTDTCIGNWHYQKGATYKSPKIIIDLLVDIVSRNGNLLLNFPLPNSGMLDDQELKILSEITKWMNTNGTAIYASRPWKMFGAGPSTQPAAADAKFNENKRKELTAEDVRFTTKGQTLFAFVMGWPRQQAVIARLATGGKFVKGRVRNVQLLGHPGKLQWAQNETGLVIQMPDEQPGSHAFAFFRLRDWT
jgi:alpha-L-fucosidase